MIHFTVQGTPVTKKNSQRIVWNPRTKRYLIQPSVTFVRYEYEALKQIPESLIDYPVNVAAVFYMPTKRKVDLVNLQEAILDVMVKAGCIIDDNSSIVVSMDGSKVKYDKENPRTEITITRIEAKE